MGLMSADVVRSRISTIGEGFLNIAVVKHGWRNDSATYGVRYPVQIKCLLIRFSREKC